VTGEYGPSTRYQGELRGTLDTLTLDEILRLSEYQA